MQRQGGGDGRRPLNHEAGLVWLDERLRLEDLRDRDLVAGVLAPQRPAWEPGTRHGYHAMTIIVDDPREKALRDAVHTSIRGLGG